MGAPTDQFTSQGLDLTFGTNVLGPYYFTKLLSPVLESTAASLSPADAHSVRVIEVASDGHLVNPALGIINYDVLRAGPARDKLTQAGILLYFMSKSGNVLVSSARARDLRERGIDVIAISLHPGMLLYLTCQLRALI